MTDLEEIIADSESAETAGREIDNIVFVCDIASTDELVDESE